MNGDYEVTQKILVFFLGLAFGAGRYIHHLFEPLPFVFGSEIARGVARALGSPLVLIVLVLLYIVAEAAEPNRVEIVETSEE